MLLLFLCAGSAWGAGFPRQVDPVDLSEVLSFIKGARIAHIGCFRAQEGQFEPIPYQIDERTEDGDLIFTKGPEAHPEDADGRLQLRDDFLILARDIGERMDPPSWPDGFIKGVEIQINDPVHHAQGYVYVGVFDRNPPRSTVDYVRYEAQANRIESESYILGFSKEAPIVFNSLVLKNTMGGNGEDPIDRMKIRLDATLRGGIELKKTEDDYTAKVIGYIDGPIRVIRRTRNRIILFWNIPSPSAIQDNYFYRDSFIFPILVSLPFDLDLFFRKASLRISVDLKSKTLRRFVNEHNRSPVLIDGKKSAAEAALDKRPYGWSAIYGDNPRSPGGWFNRLSMEDSSITPQLYYVDEEENDDPPERSAGQIGNIGYQVDDLTKLGGGIHKLTSFMYAFNAFSNDLVESYIDIERHPLQATPTRWFHHSSE